MNVSRLIALLLFFVLLGLWVSVGLLVLLFRCRLLNVYLALTMAVGVYLFALIISKGIRNMRVKRQKAFIIE